MRMSQKMREIKDQISECYNALAEAVEQENAENAEKERKNLQRLNQLYAAAETEWQARLQLNTDPEDDDKEEDKPVNYTGEIFYKAIAHQPLTEQERKVVDAARVEYKNRFSEGTGSDGGYTVPDDLSSEIFSAIRGTESVRNLVEVENVTSSTGRRLFRDGETIKLYNTAEYDEIQEMQNQNYSTRQYNQKKFAGLMSVSNELLEDSFVNFQNEIVLWLSDAARYTENSEILYGAGGETHCQGMLSTAGAYREVTCTTLSIEFLRSAYLSLKSGYRPNAKWMMNSLAYAAVSNLKYEDGKSPVQPDPRNPDGYMLFGFPIEVMDAVETEDDKTVIAFGDFKRGYRMFARRNFGISFTDIGAGAFETDSIRAKGIERFDGKIFDREAIVIIREVPVETLDLTGGTDPLSGAITEQTLKNMTKKQLLELAEELEVDGVNTESLKDDIVSAILAKVGA